MKRRVCSLIRLVASGLIFFGGLEIGLEYMRHRVRNAAFNLPHCVIGAILILLGTVLFAASGKLAAKLTDDFEE